MAFGHSRRVLAEVEHLPAYHTVHLREHLAEGSVHVGGLQGGGLHEEGLLPPSQRLRFLHGHRPYVAKVRLVADEHDDDVGVRVVAQLLHPLLNVLEGDAAAHVVDNEGAGRTSVVGAGDGSVSVSHVGQRNRLVPSQRVGIAAESIG